MEIRNRISYMVILFVLSFSFFYNDTFAQSAYNDALRDHLREQYNEFGVNRYDRERFLVGLIYVTNDVLSDRIGNISSAKEKYFKALTDIQDEVKRLKPQLGGPGTAVYQAAENLDDDIQNSINNGVIDKHQKEAYQDALQLLVMAAQNPSQVANMPGTGSSSTPYLDNVRKALAGEQTSQTPAVHSGKITVYTLYKEWIRGQVVDYQKRITDLRLIRSGLYKKGNSLQKQQMVKRDLYAAYRAFNSRQYDYASRMLEEVLTFYKKLDPKDDVLFYLGESYFALIQNGNAMDRGFKPLIDNYPNSSYMADALMRMVQISYNFKNFDKTLEYAKKYFNTASKIHRGNEDALLLAGIAAGRVGQYEKAREYLTQINNSSDYYYLSQTITGNLLILDKQYNEATVIFSRMLSSKSLPLFYRDQAIAYAGIAAYAEGRYDQAIYIMKKVSPAYQDLDMSNIALAWSDYKKNLLLPPDERDFKLTKIYTKDIINNFYGSEYELEAKSLFAQVTELDGNVDNAVAKFKDIESYYRYSKAASGVVDERNKYRALKKKSVAEMGRSLQNDDQAAYEEALGLKKEADQVLSNMTASEYSTYGTRFLNEVKSLKAQIVEAEGLKTKALESGNDDLADKADETILRLYAILNKLASQVDPEQGFNYFDGTPSAKLEAENENYNQSILNTRNFLNDERESLLNRKSELSNKIELAKRDGDYKTVYLTEIYLDEIDEILRRMDRLSTVAYASETKDNITRVEEWADYGAFGVVNSQIMEKEKNTELTSTLSRKIDDINELLDARRNIIENKIFRIEEEIAVMTRKVKEQRRRRQREEKFREFEESYFERRESETDVEGTGTEIRDEEKSSDTEIIDEAPQQIDDLQDTPPESNEIQEDTKIQEETPPENLAPTEEELQDALKNLPGGTESDNDE